MKITLHVGPHKTGTTSLQNWLLENSAVHLRKHGVYYPPVNEFAPGHAVLAWRALGQHKYEADPSSLKTIVNEAAELGAKNLVLSSECFCMGLSLGTLENLRVLNECGSVELVVTLTPLPDRFLSELAEEIKHAASFDLENIDLPGFCDRRPGLWPNLINELREEIRPAKTHVIMSTKKRPSLLVESFTSLLRIPGPNNFVTHNQRFPHSRTRLLNFLNIECTRMTAKEKLKLSGRLHEILLEEGRAENMRSICLPEITTRFLDQMWKLQSSLIQELYRNGEIELYE